MLTCPAEGCGFKARNDRALATHIRKCKKAATGLALVADEIGCHEADHRQAKQHKILSPEHLDIVPEVEVPMDTGLEVRSVNDESESRCLMTVNDCFIWQDDDQTRAMDVPLLPIDAPTPSTSRSGRIRRLPTRYQDMEISSHEVGPSLSHMPSFKTQKQQAEEAEIAEVERCRGLPSPTPPSSPTPPVELEAFRTEEDEFGRFRIYNKRPASELSNTPLPDYNDFGESGEIHQAHPEDLASGLQMPVVLIAGLSDLVGLFMNATIALLIQWFCSGTSQKSTADVQRLVDNVILHEDFKAEDLQGVNLTRELKKLDTFKSSLQDQGWKKGSVKISVPCPRDTAVESEAAEFEIEGLLYRDLTGIIQNTCQDETTMDSFHMTPFREMWRSSDDTPPIHLYGEAYTSDEMINAYEEVQNVPPHPDHPDAEHIVVEISPYSDATMLAQFGTAFL